MIVGVADQQAGDRGRAEVAVQVQRRLEAGFLLPWMRPLPWGFSQATVWLLDVSSGKISLFSQISKSQKKTGGRSPFSPEAFNCVGLGLGEGCPLL